VHLASGIWQAAHISAQLGYIEVPCFSRSGTTSLGGLWQTTSSQVLSVSKRAEKKGVKKKKKDTPPPVFRFRLDRVLHAELSLSPAYRSQYLTRQTGTNLDATVNKFGSGLLGNLFPTSRYLHLFLSLRNLDISRGFILSRGTSNGLASRNICSCRLHAEVAGSGLREGAWAHVLADRCPPRYQGKT
jgi:hypothetical protein